MRTDRPDSIRLLADIGGSNARFGWQASPQAAIADIAVLPCADFPRLEDALASYLAGLPRGAPVQCAMAIATSVLGDRVQMTNHPWSFSIEALRLRFGFERLQVLNDFTALALALPSLGSDELRQVGGAAPVAGAAIGLIGPGTGLGVSGLIPDGRGGHVALQGEGGHATLAARSPREQQVLQWLEARHGHASAERAVCGQGLVDIAAALHDIDAPASPPPPAQPAEVVAAALQHGEPHCSEAVDLFCAFLGTAAGNLALTLGARGGVYIGGGIVPRLGSAFDLSPFRRRFEDKGRFAAYLASIPVQLIVADEPPALRGAARALDQSMWLRSEAPVG